MRLQVIANKCKVSVKIAMSGGFIEFYNERGA